MRDTCSDCRKPLTDPVSQERGRGPKCEAKHTGIRRVVRVANTRRQLRRRLPEDEPLPDLNLQGEDKPL